MRTRRRMGEEVSGVAIGLPNIGNTCYINSIIQALLHIPEMKKELSERTSSSTESVTFILAQIFEELTELRYEKLAKLVGKLQANLCGGFFNTKEQQDAQEFLKMLLSALQNENNRVKKPSVFKQSTELMTIERAIEAYDSWRKASLLKEDSFVNSLFEGDLLTSITCQNCQFSSFNLEKFGELALSLHRQVSVVNFNRRSSVQLSAMITSFFDGERIDEYRCGKCDQVGEIEKRHRVLKFPAILIVVIKRFVFYPKPQKLSNRVEIAGTQLDLSPFLYSPKDKKSQKALSGIKTKGKYKLLSFIEHFGEINHGHYICYAYNQKLKGWALFNDGHVRQVGEGKEIMDNGGSVYTLFYELTG